MPTKHNPEPALLSVAEAAERVHEPVKTIRQAIDRGELPALRLGPKTVRLRPEDVLRWDRKRCLPVAALVDKPTVYRLYDVHHRLLYVGMSRNIGARMAAHAGVQPWWRRVRWVRLEHFTTLTAAARAEGEAIHRERPRYNIALPDSGRELRDIEALRGAFPLPVQA